MKAIFEKQDDGTLQMTGYATVEYSSNNPDEKTQETTETELENLVSDREKTWKQLIGGFYLENQEIKFTQGYTPEKTTQ